MIAHLIAFDTEKDLEEITGLSDDELWKNGFDLDDWDIGFQSDIKLHEEEYSSDDYLSPNGNLVWLIDNLNDYCIGPECTEYNGKYYYIAYHA